MATRQYIGARYVPVFYTNSDGTAEWRGGVIYEPLTIVTYNNNTYTSKTSVPAHIGNPSDNPQYWVATGSFNEQVATLTELVDSLQSDVDSNTQNITLMTDEIITIKAAGETIDGFPYGGFAGGAIFAGMELYAFRVAPAHRTEQGNYGKIVFYQRKPGNVFERVPITLAYDSITYGELRDPNLSVSRDGSRLYVSCFTTIDADSDVHYSLVFCLDRTLTQIGVNIIPESTFWGNTLETPTGYLLHADYYENNLTLYRTTTAITSANFGSAAWVKHTVFTASQFAPVYAEPTIGYFNRRLVMITRTSGTYSSEVAWTPDLEGLTGWTQNMGFAAGGFSGNLHAPCMMPYYKGAYLPISGSIVDASITGDAARRIPYISVLAFDNNKASTYSFIYQVAGGVVADPDEVGYFGGYTTMVRLGNDRFGVLYYSDSGDENVVQYREIGLYDSHVNGDYLTEELGEETVLYTTYAQNAYDHALIPWVMALLQGKYDHVRFVSVGSAASITDKPTGLQSNFYGVAQRVSTQYYIELNYFSGTVPKKAAITGTAETILTATWTILY